ncbi:MAG: DUF2723 domain-containing protein [Candidatus Omnitrophica bacterium]|nr:DUF2723 domain-containing protein [Candidatus Omnitrophota bacterium]
MFKKKSLFILPNKITFFIITAGLAWAVYLKTVCPAVYWYDSGEFITACYKLGIPHNPGYPLYCLLGKLFSLFIFRGSIAFKINMVSVICGALTVGFIFLGMEAFGINRIIAAVSALCLAFSQGFWSQATIAEVYTLHTLFVSLLVLSIVYLSQVKEKKNFYKWVVFAGLVFGLDLAHHLSIVLFLPGIFYVIICSTAIRLKREKCFDLKNIVCSVLVFCFCLLPPLLLYLYLPLRSLDNPVLDWGNPENWSNFIAHLSAVQRRSTQVFSLTWLQMFLRGKTLALMYLAQFSFIGIALSLTGLCFIFKRNKPLAVFLCWIIFAETFYALFLNTVSLKATVFGLPVYMVFVFFAAVSLEEIFARLKLGRRENGKLILCYKKSWAGMGVIMTLPLILLGFNFSDQNRSLNYQAQIYGDEIAKYIEEPGIIITAGDNNIFILLCLQNTQQNLDKTFIISKELITAQYSRDWYLEQLKNTYIEPVSRQTPETIGDLWRDVKLSGLDLVKNLDEADLKEEEREKEDPEKSKLENKFSKDPVINKIIKENIDRYRIYATDLVVAGAEYLLPCGPIYRISPEPVKELKSNENGFEYYSDLSEKIRLLKFKNKLDPIAVLAYAGLFNNTGAYYYRRGMLKEAWFCYQTALSLDQGYITAHYNIAVFYEDIGDMEKAKEVYNKILRLQPYCQAARDGLNALKLK